MATAEQQKEAARRRQANKRARDKGMPEPYAVTDVAAEEAEKGVREQEHFSNLGGLATARRDWSLLQDRVSTRDQAAGDIRGQQLRRHGRPRRDRPEDGKEETEHPESLEDPDQDSRHRIGWFEDRSGYARLQSHLRGGRSRELPPRHAVFSIRISGSGVAQSYPGISLLPSSCRSSAPLYICPHAQQHLILLQ